MKKTTIFGLLGFLMVIAGSLIITSCKDSFSEKDALNAQQAINLSIRAYEPYANAGVADATVTIIESGKEITQTTNATGVATFNNIKIGSNIPVSVKKDGYTEIQTSISVNTSDYRQAEFSSTLNIYALDGPSTAIIRGKVEIETDVTNDKPEYPNGQVITAYFDAGYNKVTITGTIDATGNYSIKVPSQPSGMTIYLTYPTLEVDQTIATGGFADEPAFPLQAALPAKTTIKTLFNTEAYSTSIPYVDPIYALVGTAPTGTGAKAAQLRVYVNGSTGAISSIAVIDGGKGYTASVSNLTVNIVPLTGTGSGATATATTNSSGVVTSVSVTAAGTLYPSNGSINHISQEDPSGFTPNISVQPGNIKIINLNYGTGVTPRNLRNFYN